jgi:preprotein translocase subunit YajC
MGGDIWTTVLLFVLMGGVLYFMLIRPQQKRTKEQQSLMSTLEPGSRVMLISGIIATVKYLGDKQAVVEIAPGVEMTVDKRAITTQPVVDEFEYADDEATDAVDAEVADAEALVEPAEAAEAADEPAEAAAEKADATWDNPGTTKN